MLKRWSKNTLKKKVYNSKIQLILLKGDKLVFSSETRDPSVSAFWNKLFSNDILSFKKVRYSWKGMPRLHLILEFEREAEVDYIEVQLIERNRTWFLGKRGGRPHFYFYPEGRFNINVELGDVWNGK